MTDFVGRIRSPSTTIASGRDVGWLVDRRVATSSAHPFMAWEPFSGERAVWTYARLHHDVRRVAAGLQRRSVRRGDRVILHLDNCPEFVIAWLACARIGAVVVCTNTRSAVDELAFFAEHSEAVAAITQPAYAAALDAAAPQLRWIAVTATDAGEQPASANGFADSFGALMVDSDPEPVEIGPYDPVSVQYTSGTTARPKGVVWTQANALWGARTSAVHEGLRRDDVHLTYLPLFHTNAQCYSVLATLWAGASLVLQPRFSASRFWSTSLEHRCTQTSIVAFCLRALANHDAPREHSYRLWGNGSSSPPETDRFGVRIIGWWGMTETVTHGICEELEHPSPPLSMGRPAPEYEIAVLRDDGSPVEPGETGNLLVRGVPGVSLFAGYLNDDGASHAAVDDRGWLTTGDRVTPLVDGSIRFAERAKDMLKVGGENVGASEVERVILAVPRVAEAAVVGRPDEMLGEVPVVFVVGAGDRADGDGDASLAADVLSACREQLADFKVPREVYLVDDLPRSTLEKVAKAELRRRLADPAMQRAPRRDGEP